MAKLGFKIVDMCHDAELIKEPGWFTFVPVSSESRSLDENIPAG